MNEPTLTDTERVREALADHFIMWFELSRVSGPPGEWRCQCGLKFGFSDSAVDHQARIVAARVAEAVDRERATWADRLTKAATRLALLSKGSQRISGKCEGVLLALSYIEEDQRMAAALLAADDTEGKP